MSSSLQPMPSQSDPPAVGSASVSAPDEKTFALGSLVLAAISSESWTGTAGELVSEIKSTGLLGPAANGITPAVLLACLESQQGELSRLGLTCTIENRPGMPLLIRIEYDDEPEPTYSPREDEVQAAAPDHPHSEASSLSAASHGVSTVNGEGAAEPQRVLPIVPSNGGELMLANLSDDEWPSLLRTEKRRYIRTEEGASPRSAMLQYRRIAPEQTAQDESADAKWAPWRIAVITGILVLVFGLGAFMYHSAGALDNVVKTVELQALADHGDADAQYELGMRYLSGNSVPQNRELGLRWLEKAATQGDSRAQYELGTALMFDSEFERAYPWLALAEAAGSQEAAGVLRGLTAKLSKSQLASAQYEVGIMFADGIGVPPNHIAAYTWYRLAELAGNTEAHKQMLVLQGLMTKSEITEAMHRASSRVAN